MNQTSPSDAGFVSVDAMVALTILATTVVLALGATKTATRLTAAAAEMRQAEVELRYLLDTAPRTPGVSSGQGAHFSWRMANLPLSSVRDFQICRRTATIRSIGSKHVYSLATVESCPREG